MIEIGREGAFGVLRPEKEALESPERKKLACEQVLKVGLFASGLTAWVTRVCHLESRTKVQQREGDESRIGVMCFERKATRGDARPY